jgi:hypothetical protein
LPQTRCGGGNVPKGKDFGFALFNQFIDSRQHAWLLHAVAREPQGQVVIKGSDAHLYHRGRYIDRTVVSVVGLVRFLYRDGRDYKIVSHASVRMARIDQFLAKVQAIFKGTVWNRVKSRLRQCQL